MANITFKANLIHTIGKVPQKGEKAKDFLPVVNDISGKTLDNFKGSKLLLKIFPSRDTDTYAMSVRAFNKTATSLKDTTVLCISRDLPFAHKRFCGAEGIENVITLFDNITGDFGKDYCLEIMNGTHQGLRSRCVSVLDKDRNVIYTQQVAETLDEPDYQSTLDALN